jgi:hypothetical protein
VYLKVKGHLNYPSRVPFYSVNQFRAVKCFLEKTAVISNVIGLPWNMECVQGATKS